MKKGDTYYYARTLKTGVFEVCELRINTVTSNYFTGVDTRDKRTYMFDYPDLNVTVFKNRNDALSKVKMEEEKYDYRNKENLQNRWWTHI